MTPHVIGFGAGGHAKVVLEILLRRKSPDEIGLLNPDKSLHGTCVMGVHVLGGDELLSALVEQGVGAFFVGVGSTGQTSLRAYLYEQALNRGLEPVDAVHPASVISPSALVGKGVTVGPCAVINAEARVGANVIVNTGVIVEHNSIIQDHVHLATGAVLSGGVIVGRGAHVGAGATIRQGIHIGDGAVIGAGAVVIRDVEPHTVVAGVPASPLRIIDYSSDRP